MMEEMSTSNGGHPIYFGLSCAFTTLQSMKTRGLDVDHGRQSRMVEAMLQGSACLLGLLMERAQRREEVSLEKLKAVELELCELKRIRAEDAKANEKVVGIFAAHEQSWIAERKKLRHRIQVLTSELQVFEGKYEEDISNLNKRIEEDGDTIRLKEESLEEEVRKREELEEKLQLAEEVGEELREKAAKEAQDHSAELWKHKTAFMELVSSQRQLEAEIGRALRQGEAVRQEFEEVAEQKEEAMAMVEKMATEVAKLEKDGEQKDKILSAMLRKSKLDTAEKQMLLKEMKISKAKKKQAELEIERWRDIWESRHKKSSRALHEVGSSKERRADSQIGGDSSGYYPRTLLLEYFEAESGIKHEPSVGKGVNTITTLDCYDQYSSEGNDEIASIDDIQQLKEWVRMETEKYATILEERHYEEIEAFTEQMRLKDEKLEAMHWRLLSMELGSKRLQSHSEGLDGTISQFREENIKLEALLLDKEKELKLVKEQFNFYVQHCPKSSSNYTNSPVAADLQALWSEVKISKKKSKEKEQEVETDLTIDSENTEGMYLAKERPLMQLEDQENKANVYEESVASAITTASSNDLSLQNEHAEVQKINCTDELCPEEPENKEMSSGQQAKSVILMIQSPNEEIEEEKEVNVDPGEIKRHKSIQQYLITPEKSVSARQTLMKKDHSWKMDIQALGVSYKIKRLKQQLQVIERLAGDQAPKPTTAEHDPPRGADSSHKRKLGDNREQMKGLLTVISLLNKQLRRYQSLEDKTDELCRRMHENYRTGGRRDSHRGKTREQTEALQHFLEETFQLQRFMVATGQKMMEVESRISSKNFSNACGLGESLGFNFGQFGDVVRSLFKEIQRGLGVRIARIIGDLEGTLACDGILHRCN